MSRTHKALFLAGLMALGGAFGIHSRAASEPAQPILFGVLPVNQPQAMAQRFGPLIAYLDPATQQKVLDTLLAMHGKDLDALKAIDPKYERWVAVQWSAYRPVKETIDRVHGAGFYELKD